MVFDKISNVLRSAVNAPGGFEPILELPFASRNARTSPPEDKPGRVRGRDQHVDHAFRHHLGILADRSPGCAAQDQGVGSEGEEAAEQDRRSGREQIGDQVRRSQVTLEAKIRLQDLTLGTISKLDGWRCHPLLRSAATSASKSAPTAENCTSCEFGRSGESYTVRVKDTINSDDDLIRHLMN